MKTTVNTLGKYKEYKERKVREFIMKYDCFCGISWKYIQEICLLSACIVVILIFFWCITDVLLLYCSDKANMNILDCLKGIASNSNFGVIYKGECVVVFLFAICFLAYKKNKRSLIVQGIVYDCLQELSNYEKYIADKIEFDILYESIKANDQEIEKNKRLIEIINFRIETCKQSIESCVPETETHGKNVDEYNKTINEQELFNHMQTKSKYETNIALLTDKGTLLQERRNSMTRVKVSIGTIISDIELITTSSEKTYIKKHKVLSKEIKILFIDLIYVVSNIKII